MLNRRRRPPTDALIAASSSSSGSSSALLISLGLMVVIFVLAILLPFVAYWVTRRACEELRARELTFGSASPIRRIRRGPGGGFSH